MARETADVTTSAEVECIVIVGTTETRYYVPPTFTTTVTLDGITAIVEVEVDNLEMFGRPTIRTAELDIDPPKSPLEMQRFPWARLLAAAVQSVGRRPTRGEMMERQAQRAERRARREHEEQARTPGG